MPHIFFVFGWIYKTIYGQWSPNMILLSPLKFCEKFAEQALQALEKDYC